MVSQHALQVVSQHALLQGLGRGWYPSMPCRSPGPHTPKAEVEGSVLGGRGSLGVSRPTPRGKLRGLAMGGSPGPHPGGKLRGLAWGGGHAHTQGVSQHALRQTPQWVLLWAVSIPLECILVYILFSLFIVKFTALYRTTMWCVFSMT